VAAAGAGEWGRGGVVGRSRACVGPTVGPELRLPCISRVSQHGSACARAAFFTTLTNTPSGHTHHPDRPDSGNRPHPQGFATLMDKQIAERETLSAVKRTKSAATRSQNLRSRSGFPRSSRRFRASAPQRFGKCSILCATKGCSPPTEDRKPAGAGSPEGPIESRASSLRSTSSSWSCSASGRIATLRSRRRGGVLCDAPGRTPEPNRPKSEARTWLAETFGSLSPSRARSASAGTIRRIRASGTTRSASSSGSTAAGAGAIGRTARPAELVGASRGP
jgi:hypothetical protein